VRPLTLGILGIGAIGGSVARRAKLGGVPLVLGWSPEPAERVAAVRDGLVDDAPAHAAELARRCDLMVLAGTPATNLRWLETLGPRSRALFTDTGMAKRVIVARAAALGLAARFAGSRPAIEPAIAGVSGARADLLEGAAIYVTPVPDGDAAAREVADFWDAACGAHPVLIDADRHDALVADAAQLAPLVAAAVATAVRRRLPPGTPPGRLVRDVTGAARDAGASYVEGLWQNRDHARDALRAVADAAARLADALDASDARGVGAALDAASRWRVGLDT
jgi:prephenate dehydrogenase